MAQTLKDEVKYKIKNGAIQVFTDKGYKGTSIKEIARVSGVSVGNLYRYYENKEALYAEVVEGVYTGIYEIMSQVEDDIYIPMQKFIDIYRTEQKAFEMVIRGERDEHYGKIIGQFTSMLRDFFLNHKSEFIEVGTFEFVEASAFANALVFGVIDLTINVSDDHLDDELMLFVARMIKGYFYMRKKG